MITIEKLNLFQHRHFLETIWHETHSEWKPEENPEIISTYMCRYTCIFLKEIIKREYGIIPEIKSGRPEAVELNGTPQGKYGYKDNAGNWHDHSWLLIENKIIDLTADQFGGNEVILTDVSNENYNPSLDQKVFDESFEKLSVKASTWVEKFYNEKKLLKKT